MMRIKMYTSAGFTLLEVIFVMAILAILAGIATPLYQGYQDRAKATDVISRYEEIRTRLLAETPGQTPSCLDLDQNLPKDLYDDRYVNMSLGFVPSAEPGHGEPILNICATAGTDRQVSVAAAALTMFRNMQNVTANPIKLKSVVSFSVYFGGKSQLICAGALPQTVPFCGSTTNGFSQGPSNSPQVILQPSQNSQEVTPQTGNQPPVTPTPVKGKDKPDLKPEGSGTAATPGTTPDSGNTPPQIPGQTQEPDQTGQTSSQTSAAINQGTGTQTQENTGSQSGSQGNQNSNSGSSGIIQQQECQQNCRSKYPHGNSRAYRDCLSACRL